MRIGTRAITMGLAAAALLILLPTSLWAQEFIPLAEVQPGMRGVGKTVFEGTNIEEFDLVVLDVLKNFNAQKDLILVRLEGPRIEHTGWAAGMSGSPIYLEGRLAGALAYGFGAFPKDAIGGVTPIEQMLEVERAGGPSRPQPQSSLSLSPAPLELADLLPDLVRLWEGKEQGHPHPIETPLTASGLDPKAAAQLRRLMEPLGMMVVPGGGVDEQGPAFPLVPGAPVAGVLMKGDIGLAGIGTVTHREGDRILAFGHPFLFTGEARMPMAEAYISTTLASLAGSFKLGRATRTVGTIQADYLTGIAGQIGQAPDLLTVTVRVSHQNGQGEFSYDIIREPNLPGLTATLSLIGLLSSLESSLATNRAQTYTLRALLRTDQGILKLENRFSGPGAVLEAARFLSPAVSAILGNPFSPMSLDGLEVEVEAVPGRRTASLTRVWVEGDRLRPGDTLHLALFLDPYDGPPIRKDLSVIIPPHLPQGDLVLVVGGGSFITQWEQQTNPPLYQPRSLPHLLRLLERIRRDDTVYVYVTRPGGGAIVEGAELPSLPPSVLGVLGSPRTTGESQLLRSLPVLEEAIQTEYVITGGEEIRLTISP